ncbi:MAG: acyltransferase [Rubrivivax sp.]
MKRLYFVDWLRIIAFALLVLYHVGMVYVPWDYHVKHVPTYAALEPVMRLTSPWRMSLLFVVSGIATGLMRGRRGTVAERARRLLLPLLFGMAIVVPLQPWLQVRDQFGYTGSFADFLWLYFSGYHGFCRGGDCLRLPTWNHLWFLPYLWCYTLLAWALWRWLPQGWLQALADRAGRLQGWRLLVWPTVAIALLRIVLLPRFPETHALLGDGWAHATYGLMFAIGLLLARQRQLFTQLDALRWPALWAAVVAWALLLGYWALTQGAADLPEIARLPARIAFATEQWCAIVAAFGFAHHHLNRDHRWRRPLNEAVFPLYIVHQTIIVGAAVSLRPLALSAGAEATLIVGLTFAGGVVTWQMARRVAALRPWLGLAPAPHSRAAT